MSDPATTRRELKYWQAINQALAEEMSRDDRVVLLGQDLAHPGGTFGESRGLLDQFGPTRVRDTPISEQAMMGAAVGAALAGLRPVVEFIFVDFLGIASDQLVNQAAKIPYFSRGELPVPLVVKCGVGTSQGMGAQHAQALEAWYAHIPGLSVCWAGTPRDAKGLLKAAIRADGPVLFLESLSLLRTRGEVGGDEELVPAPQGDLIRTGGDLTLVTWGSMRHNVLAATDRLSAAGLAADVIDLRWISPWDTRLVAESVRRTNRCIVVTEAVTHFGPSAEIAAWVGEHCFDDLDGPVVRLGSPSVPAPHYAQYDMQRLPSCDAIVACALEIMGRDGSGPGLSSQANQSDREESV